MTSEQAMTSEGYDQAPPGRDRVGARASELAVQAQGSAWAARALFSLEAVGNAALFPFAVFLAAAALGHAGTLPRWLRWAGSALAVLVALLAVGATADLDLDPAGRRAETIG
jgi:hypothetical protein